MRRVGLCVQVVWVEDVLTMPEGAGGVALLDSRTVIAVTLAAF